MSRFKIFASVIPLILAGVFARESLSPQPQPCIRVGNVAVQMATAPWQSQSRVSFTDNPALCGSCFDSSGSEFLPFQVEVAAPEPGTVMLAGLALALLGLRCRARR